MENNIEYWCQGSCIITHGRHNSDIKHVHVFNLKKDLGKLYYCSYAIAEAKRNGFNVKELEEVNK